MCVYVYMCVMCVVCIHTYVLVLCDNQNFMIIVMRNIIVIMITKIVIIVIIMIRTEINDLQSRYCFSGQILYPATKAGVHITDTYLRMYLLGNK